MVNLSVNTARLQQNFLTNVTQDNQQNCSSSATSNENNNVIIINNSSILGDFTGESSTITTDATCLISSSMEDSIQSIMSASAQQANTSASGIFSAINFDAGVNNYDSKQNITNNISQINQSLCNASSIQSQSGNYIYVSNSFVGGNFVGQTTNANPQASCSMSNYMKNVTYNSAQSSVTQKNTSLSLLAIIGIIVAIVVIIVIVVMLSSFAKGQRPLPPTAAATPGGIPPDELSALLGPAPVGGLAATGETSLTGKPLGSAGLAAEGSKAGGLASEIGEFE